MEHHFNYAVSIPERRILGRRRSEAMWRQSLLDGMVEGILLMEYAIPFILAAVKVRRVVCA